ncbi:MAG TPA: ABC transporter substrate-binding protein [Actinomycetes bacterium]|nr:ABC transporter substrate-binding protein [Actinomycetes bacterium]
MPGRRIMRLLAALAALTAGGALALAGAGTPALGADSKVTFTVGVTQDVDSLNPFTGITAAAYEIYQLNYDTLTDYAQKDFSTVPSLAESWDTSSDGLTWTYHLRAGLTWSDGQPLTANDVAYTFNRVRNGKYEQTNYGNYVAAITSVTATDDTTVVMKVKKPTPIMLHLYVYILPEHIWKDIDEKEVKHYTNEPGPNGIVGSGPFIVVEHQKGQFIRLERNPNYWGTKPKVDEIVFRVFTNEDSMAQALRRGEIDFADELGSNVFKSLQGVTGIKTVDAEYSGFDEIAFNTGAALDDGTPIGDGHPALKDPRVRQALSYAIDTKAITDRVYGGHGTPGTSVIPPIYQALHYDPGSTAYTFDPTKAGRLLDQAGYTKGKDGIRTVPSDQPGGGQPLSFRLYGRSNSQTSQQTVQFVAGWLKDVGIDVKSKIVSEDALTEIIGEGKYDMFEWGWVVEPDPNYQLSTFTCANRSYKDGGQVYANLSDSFYCDKQYDALNQQQSEQIDPTERAATVKQMQKMLYDAAPYVITTYYNNLEAYRSDKFTGFLPQPEPNGSLLFQYGTASYRNIEPVSEATKSGGGGGTKPVAAEDSSSSGALIAGIVIAVIVVAGVVFFVVRNRRRTQADVE